MYTVFKKKKKKPSLVELYGVIMLYSSYSITNLAVKIFDVMISRILSFECEFAVEAVMSAV